MKTRRHPTRAIMLFQACLCLLFARGVSLGLAASSGGGATGVSSETDMAASPSGSGPADGAGGPGTGLDSPRGEGAPQSESAPTSRAGEPRAVTGHPSGSGGEGRSQGGAVGSADDLLGRLVRDVEIRLEGPYRLDDLHHAIVVKPGQPLSGAEVARSIELLYRLGAIDDIVAEAEAVGHQVRLRFRVWPSVIVSRVRLRGNEQIQSRRLLEQLTLRPGTTFSEYDAKLQARHLVRFYQSEGFFDAVVSVHSSMTRKRTANVTFEIDEAAQARISQLLFVGNENFSPRILQQVVGWEEGDTFRPAEMEERRKALVEHYRDAGYLSARVRTSYDLDSKLRVVLRFEVEEGARIRFRFYSARLPEAGPFGGAFWYRVYHWLGLTDPDRQARRILGIRRRHWMKVLELDTEQHFSTGFMEDAAERMRSSMILEGFNGPKVASKRLVEQNGRQVVFEFVVDPGRKVRIERVVFRGYRFLDDQILRELFDEAMQRFAPAGIYTEEALGRAIGLMVDYYRSQGFLRVRVNRNVTIDDSAALLKAGIEVVIQEGPRTLVREIDISGNTVFTEGELRELLAIVPGEPYDPARIRSTIERLRARYASNGYVNAQVFATRRAQGDSQSAVVLEFEIDEGVQSRVGEVIVRGARRTRPHVIARELTIGSGDVYSKEAIEESRRKLRSTGLFQKAVIYPVAGERVRDMMVEVEERKARVIALTGGVVLSGYEPTLQSAQFDTSLEAVHYNLWGLGHRLTGRMELEASYLPNIRERATEQGIFEYSSAVAEDLVGYLNQATSRRVIVSYGSPYLFGLGLESLAGVTLFEREQQPTYLLRRNSVSWAVSKHFGRYLNTSVRLETSLRRLDAAETDEKVQMWGIDREQRLFLQASTLWLYDRRDSKRLPDRGFLVNLHGEVIQAFGCDTVWEGLESCPSGNLESAEAFARVVASGTAMAPIFSWLRGEARITGGLIQSLQGEEGAIPVERRFYLGGAGTVRGFLQESLGPVRFREKSLPNQVVYGWTTVPTGGNLTVSYTLEGQIVLERLSSWFEDLELALFHDAGNVFWVGAGRSKYRQAVQEDLGNPALQPALAESCRELFLNDSIRTSAGVGLRWRTSIGQIRLDLGFPLQRQCTLERPWAAHFSIGVL